MPKTWNEMTIVERGTAWIEALRSGKYPQTTGNLCVESTDETSKRSAGYCCLGVVCEVAIELGAPITKQLEVEDPDTYDLLTEFRFEDGSYEGGILPDPMLKSLGLTHHQQNRLTALNDEEDKDFSEIADILEDFYLRGESFTGGF